jgi:aminoglycoside phosphotransferase (APT) family kinase protein
MNESILKSHWERFTAHINLDIATANKLLLPYTKDSIDQLTLLSEGCANTNYKITFKNGKSPVVVRIYVREKSALKRELGIHKLVKSIIPVPRHLYTNASCNNYTHPYAIMEWIDGMLMREVIFTSDENAISQCAFEAGRYLDKLRQIPFAEGGFFQEDMKIRPFDPGEQYLPFVMMLLQDPIVTESLGNDLHATVKALVTKNVAILPSENDSNLTHADYDPANMLVKQINGRWEIAAILDWEFAFAGTYLLDIGMMLRYSHKLPACYENSFISGIQHSGFHLPPNWKKQAKLMDLLCLLNLTHYNPPTERPKMNSDVVSLIGDTVNNWDLF